MHADISEHLNDLAKQLIASVKAAADYDNLKAYVMQAEVMLGEAERQYDADDENYDGYLVALDGVWGNVCQEVVKKSYALESVDDSFYEMLNPDDGEITSALHDNYFYGALAAVMMTRGGEDEPLKLPYLAAAAFNKHSYSGYKDEIACLRILLWAGFDPNAADQHGRTALHFMASTKMNPYSHPRAVRLLLQAGINPNLKNMNGDTALCFMAGNQTWTDTLNQSAWMLLNNGADPFAKANDGECAYSLWKKNQNSRANLAEIVAAIEKVAEPSPAAEGNREDEYYNLIGQEISLRLATENAVDVLDFFGYVMAINIAKKLGQSEDFAREIMPIMLDGFDGGHLIDVLAPYLLTGDTTKIGQLAHGYLSDAADARFASVKAQMQNA